jgi:predicted RNA-binding Zn ribbon-like protein
MSPHIPPHAIAKPSRAGSLELVGGALALDLTNTSSGRGTASHQEHLRDFDTVLQWVQHARIVTAGECAAIRKAVSRDPKRAHALFTRVVELRELIFLIANAIADGRAVPEKLRTRLTTMHAGYLRHAGLQMRDGIYLWSWKPRDDIEAAILGPITLSALTLLMEKDLSRTRRCAGLECGWLFHDTTKNRRRRWCEMRVCGNRAKVRAARARRKRGVASS